MRVKKPYSRFHATRYRIFKPILKGYNFHPHVKRVGKLTVIYGEPL